jgi:hypothetical protein
MAALLYLEHFNLSDEELVERWSENVVWPFFSGMTYDEPCLPCDATQIGRFRRVLGEAGVEQLLKPTIEASVAMGAVKKTEFERVIVDTTVQEKTAAPPPTAGCWKSHATRSCGWPSARASSSSSRTSARARRCGGAPPATRTPSAWATAGLLGGWLRAREG